MADQYDHGAAGFMAQYGYSDSYARDDLADLLRAIGDKALVETWNDAIETAARMVHRGTEDQALEDRVRSLKR